MASFVPCSNPAVDITSMIIIIILGVFQLSKQTSASNVLTISDSFNSLLYQFQRCHLKFYFDLGRNLENFNRFEAILEHLTDNDLSISLSVQKYVTDVIPAPDKLYWSKHTQRKLSICFVHLYMTGTVWHDFPQQEVMEIESWLTRPELTIFFTVPRPVGYWVHNFTLISSHYMGLTYAVTDFKRVSLVCVTCAVNIYPREEVKIPSEERRRVLQSTNLHRLFISNDLNLSVSLHQNLQTCDGTQDYRVFEPAPSVEACILFKLSEKLNFSYLQMEGRQLAHAQWRTPLSQEYLENEILPERKQILEFGLVFDRRAFIVTKNRDKAYDIALVRPFDLAIWMGIFYHFWNYPSHSYCCWL